MTDNEREGGTRLFDQGLVGDHVDEFRSRVRSLVNNELVPIAKESEAAGRFDRRALLELVRAGLIQERWSNGFRGDTGRAVVIGEELGLGGLGGLGVGLSLHVETACGILMRFARGHYQREILRGALDGTMLGCVAASEPGSGSDLSSVSLCFDRVNSGWRVVGEKKFVSLGTVADFALVLGKISDKGQSGTVVAIVPKDVWTVRKVHDKVGMASLDTAWLGFEGIITDEAMVGSRGAGLLALTWGLTYERLSVAAQVVGATQLAIGLATAHATRRQSFGMSLLSHQAVRLRLGELASEVRVLSLALSAAAAAWDKGREVGMRDIAGIKATVARRGERVLSECMHLFGGAGYLNDETPLGRLWRDMRLARIGAGTDEMMWELVASQLVPDFERYERDVNLNQ